MREIEFRGKRVDNGEWVYGCLVYNSQTSCRYIFCLGFSTRYTGGYEEHEVIPETVGQYTGLEDKNGKEIYEGDIVNDGGYLGVVEFGEWNKWLAGYYLNCLSFGTPPKILITNNCEVIGNTHDNTTDSKKRGETK